MGGFTLLIFTATWTMTLVRKSSDGGNDSGISSLVIGLWKQFINHLSMWELMKDLMSEACFEEPFRESWTNGGCWVKLFG